MERNVTNPFTEYRNQIAGTALSENSPTWLELQRWEDDGGAVLPDLPRRGAERRHREPAEKLAA